ncbi:hypothetical protein ACV332_29315, partial [Pseudomonas aeruginosa]
VVRQRRQGTQRMLVAGAFDSAGYEHALRALPTLPDDE